MLKVVKEYPELKAREEFGEEMGLLDPMETGAGFLLFLFFLNIFLEMEGMEV